MRATLAAALAALSFLPGMPAEAGPPPAADGRTCGFTLFFDPTSGGDAVIGELRGGPIVVADLANLVANPVEVTLVCTIQTGTDWTHNGTDAVSASATGTTAAVLPPTPFSAEMPPGQPTSLCTALVVEDARGEVHHLYFDHVGGGGTNEFSTSPDAACVGACTQPMFGGSCEPPPCRDRIHLNCSPVLTVVELAGQAIADHVDPLICQVLAVAFPPEGDIPPSWDCPPYGD